MLSPKAQELSKALNDHRNRSDKAKTSIVDICRTAVLVLKTTAPALADEMERRIFLLDSENSTITDLIKNDTGMEAMMELLGAPAKKG